LEGAGHAPGRRQLSLRWFAGSAATAIVGSALMGGALLAAVDGETRFGRDPTTTSLDQIAPARADGPPSARKGDRLPPRAVEQQTRRIVQIATSTRLGEREIVRTRPFARVNAQLSLQRTALSASIPPFNPLRIMADAGQPTRAPPPQARDLAGEMTVVARAPADVADGYGEEDALSPDAVLGLVRRAMTLEMVARPSAATAPAETAITPEHLIAALSTLSFVRSGHALVDPMGEARSRVSSANVTQVERSRGRSALAAAEQAAGGPGDETLHVVRRGETLAALLVANGATLAESRTILEAIGRRFRAADLREGHRLRIATVPGDGPSPRRVIARVSIANDRQVLATAVLTDLGQYAAIDLSELVEEAAGAAEEEEEEVETVGATPSLYIALYETALRNGVPRAMIDELVRLYSYDVDFQRRVRPGDSFEVFYAAEEEGGAAPTVNDILYASLTVGGEMRRYFRFRTEDDGIVDFFDERGRSARKFLVRTPINGAQFRSGFGMRRHPLLGYWRMHTGVDWSGPIGTPIMSAGNGTVIKADWVSGYGRRVEIQHANGYVTTYSHLSAFGRNVQRGTRVAQGQIIGYLGNTGLSTGPHLHYEVLVNGSFVDPMRIRVPRERNLEGRVLADFERERERIEQMMRRAGPVQVARGR
jgi:murein DD-endopeptidase MepM/ murein hydrolase activator NlpD